MSEVNIFWFRRDLRLEDNAGLYHALNSGFPVIPLFIFDRFILDELENPSDRRVSFIYQAVNRLKKQLEKSGSTIIVQYGNPEEIFKSLSEKYKVRSVFANHDYEPYAVGRDEKVKLILEERQVNFFTFKDQVIFEKNEIVKDDGQPYSIFTPYSRKWLRKLEETGSGPFNTSALLKNFLRMPPGSYPALTEMGFESSEEFRDEIDVDEQVITHYDTTRNIPSLKGTSRLGVHLRFGTISIRSLVKIASGLNKVFLNELVWREFFMQMLWQNPHMVTSSCKKEYDKIQWRNNENEFDLWCRGMTGYPIVDAGMRELNATGFMHNRVRMITASFLVKHLLIDWRWGESFFAAKLMDYELASNVGNWQWVAGCGCDAAPYFRIFNPTIQAKKFDPKLEYIRKWVPELDTFSYPLPIIEHDMARQRCMQTYKSALAE